MIMNLLNKEEKIIFEKKMIIISLTQRKGAINVSFNNKELTELYFIATTELISMEYNFNKNFSPLY